MTTTLRSAGALFLLLASCATPHRGVPAVVVRPTTESRAALQDAIATALGGPVTLADDALTGASELTVERRRARDPSGRLAQGRELEPPERFRLLKDGARCVLVHERTGRRFPLTGTECVPR